MKTELLAILAAQRQLALAVDTFAATWAADENTRNRPQRQKLTTDLMNSCPRALLFGSVVDRIAKECNIELFNP